ncbi:unnamed protein product [Penicillium glandicola]
MSNLAVKYELDEKGNISVEDLNNSTRLGKAVSRLKPLRDVDWAQHRLKSTFLRNTRHAVAAHIQRCGDIRTAETACTCCQRGNGPFKSCVVLNSKATQSLDAVCECIQAGHCMNCYFGSQPHVTCSLGRFYKNRLPKKEVGIVHSVDSNDNPLQYLQAKKRKRTIDYDRTYYQSPLDQSDIKGKGNFAEKRQALESIHTVYDRVLQDIDRLFKTLSDANELDADESTEHGEEDLVVVGADKDVKHPERTAGKDVVEVEETEKKDVKIVETVVKEEEDEEKPTISRKPRAARRKGKDALAVEEK